MSLKATAAVVAAAEGHPINVSELCRSEGCSRKTFYKWVKRYRQGGLDALKDRSTRPHSSPHQIRVEVEDAIVRLRKELRDAGLDHGATTIQWHLGRRGLSEVPSVAGVHRVLVRRGLVDPQPSKRPKSSWKRFEAAAPNERWQIDAMDWVIAIGVVRVFNIVDDHSRVAIASRCVPEATTETAWATFSQATTIWGPPAGVLSDNGLCFSGKLRGFEVLFEANLRKAGIAPSTGRPYHPQTTGKVERFQQTLKKWLRRQPLAKDLAELQAQLDEFCRIYNHERPHQGISRQIPIDRWNGRLPSRPASQPIDHPDYSQSVRRSEHAVRASGIVHADGLKIHLGVEWAGMPAVVLIDTDRASVIIDNHLVRHLVLDRTRDYQPSARRRGGPRRPRLSS